MKEEPVYAVEVRDGGLGSAPGVISGLNFKHGQLRMRNGGSGNCFASRSIWNYGFANYGKLDRVRLVRP
jgi:hypothetical protein